MKVGSPKPKPARMVKLMSNTLTIREASASWLSHLESRRRHPIKISSAKTFESYTAKWIDPHLGDLVVGAVGVAVLREFIAKLDAAGLSAKTQTEITSCVKSIVASVCDAEGDPLFPRRWDNERLDLPIVNREEQRTPMISREQIESMLANAGSEAECALYACLAGAGLRINEALAIKLGDPNGPHTVFDSAESVIHIRRGLWRGREQTTVKTPSAVRSVEVPYVLGALLAKFAGSRDGSYLFGNGTPLRDSTLRTRLKKHIGSGSFHGFRRFYVSHRRASGMPEDVLKYLIGHSTNGDITSRYSFAARDAARRRAEVEKCGLGFELPGGPR